jgi:protocatechuate 3,4-dioxygenase beta subunit
MILKKRTLEIIASTTGVMIVLSVLTILSFTILLPQFSLAQTGITNTSQISEVQSQTKGVITPCNVTESTLQGPEYKAEPPLKEGQDFAKGIKGERLVLSGSVLNVMTCKPVQGAVLDIWQSNSSGDYDYTGYNLRGKIVTDKDGNYVLDTVYPERIRGEGNMTRPSHIHVIVGVPGQPLVTTQIYFERLPDSAIKDSLIVTPDTLQNGTKITHFDFAVEDFRGFDISKGLRHNPTIGAAFGDPSINQSKNK